MIGINNFNTVSTTIVLLNKNSFSLRSKLHFERVVFKYVFDRPL